VLMTTLFMVTPAVSARPSNLPVLFVCHILMVMRDIAFVHSNIQTTALRSYLTIQLQHATSHQVAELLTQLLKVKKGSIEIKERITVRATILEAWARDMAGRGPPKSTTT